MFHRLVYRRRVRCLRAPIRRSRLDRRRATARSARSSWRAIGTRGALRVWMPRSPISRTLAAALAAVIATSPGLAVARVHTVTVDAHGFTPKYVNVKPGDTVTWIGLGRTTSIAAVNNVATVDPNEVCVAPSSDPSHVNAYRRAFDPTQANEVTGPTRHGGSGIWALGPGGDAVSDIEL